MPLVEEITQIIDDIIRGRWEITEGRVIPETDDIGLGNKGVKLNATMLYADLADSTEMAISNQEITAEVYKAFLACCSKIILLRDGSIRSFDGDRVMGVFIGDYKNTNAVKAALHIKYVFNEILAPKFKAQYAVFRDGTLKLNYSVGVDTSSVLVARAGIRNNNDLVWIGQAPNIAAKLSTLRESPFNSFITKAVYDAMDNIGKLSNGVNMWESRTWNTLPMGLRNIYRSNCQWRP
jgi:adenylate cyclase